MKNRRWTPEGEMKTPKMRYEQMSLFDCLTERAEPREMETPPDAEWWQWNSDNSLAVHQRRVNGFVTPIETVKPGGALHNMCRNGLKLLSWVDAQDQYYSSRPLQFLQMIELCVHGRDIRRYIKAQGVSPTAFGANRSEDYIVRRVTEMAVEEVYSIAFEDAVPKIKEWANGMGREFAPDIIAAWFGTGGSSGPDCIDLKHDGKGIEIDWSRSEPGSIYPIKLTWNAVYRIMQDYEE